MESPTYTLTNTFTCPNAIIRVYRPNLTEEERAKRHQDLYDAAVKILKEVAKYEHRTV